MREIAPRQELFAKEYLVDLNATQAAIRAGYSAKTARSQGQRLLTNVDVAQAIAQFAAERTQRVELTVEEVLRELARIAFFDPRRLFEFDGQPKLIHELDDDVAAVVVGLDVVEAPDGAIIRKYKLADKLGALTTLIKVLGFAAPEKVEHDHTVRHEMSPEMAEFVAKWGRKKD